MAKLNKVDVMKPSEDRKRSGNRAGRGGCVIASAAMVSAVGLRCFRGMFEVF